MMVFPEEGRPQLEERAGGRQDSREEGTILRTFILAQSLLSARAQQQEQEERSAASCLFSPLFSSPSFNFLQEMMVMMSESQMFQKRNDVEGRLRPYSLSAC